MTTAIAVTRILACKLDTDTAMDSLAERSS
jgi:hypothetical protein